MSKKNFLFTYIFGLLVVLVIFGSYQFLAVKVGEVNINSVTERQLNNSKDIVLFNSGINQEVFPFKSSLYKKINPNIVVLGSSRGMQARKEFFNDSFLNFSGAFRGVADLEDYAIFIKKQEINPELTIIFMDPWWFNPNSSVGAGPRHGDYPKYVTLDHFFNSVKLLKQGNWIKKSLNTNSLGIYSILREDGYASDGSYHYVQSAKGTDPNADIEFQSTLNRVKKEIYPFEWSNFSDQILISRGCAAVKEINKYSAHTLIIAPPFAKTVWKEMKDSNNYGYIDDTYKKISLCMNKNIEIFFESEISNDCEFIDGYHGGDNTYARIILELSNKYSQLRDYFNKEYLELFILSNSGYATGITKDIFNNGIEDDFLKLGCVK